MVEQILIKATSGCCALQKYSQLKYIYINLGGSSEYDFLFSQVKLRREKRNLPQVCSLNPPVYSKFDAWFNHLITAASTQQIIEKRSNLSALSPPVVPSTKITLPLLRFGV